MDNMIYTAMTGASHVLEMQANTANNLANLSTTGFRAQIDTFRAVPVLGSGLPTRTFVAASTVGTDFSPGPMQQTGNSLDVAVQGSGWIAVDMGDGTQAYTRNGSLKINENGLLQTQSGQNVVGIDDGPITVPPNEQVTIGTDGTVSSIPTTGVLSSVSMLGQIKLVNPPEATLVRGDDGYFRTRNGKPAPVDPSVTVEDGAVEGSNVSAVSAMVDMISLGRQFEMQMKLLTNAENNDMKASGFMTLV
ncbi:MAG: flagellar basal-body rod protein FlgF [Betaproteobacteria bacterium]|nr:flagellar basal-body rod protein FlgF [Betaproteobacteria bacterium]